MMLDRRIAVIGVALGGVAGCDPPQPQRPHTDMIFVTLLPTQSGYEARVDGEPVELADLDAAVLAAALETNAGFTEQQARADVMVALSAEAGTPHTAVIEVMRRLRFQKVVFVAEDRRL